MQLGRRAPKNAPALYAASFLIPPAPEHAPACDNLTQVTDWGLYGNDQYGDCGPVSVANQRKQVTRYLTGREQSPTQADVFDLYRRSGNPNFDPATGADDNGVDMQTMLEAVHTGGIAGTKCVGFAKIDTSNLDEVHAAIAIFGSVLLGVNLQVAQQAQTGQHLWEYTPGSPVWGGHAVLAGSYTANPGADVAVITWADTVTTTDPFWTRQVEEAWVVIWPEHLGTVEFQTGVDMAALASDYRDLTGRPFPIPAPSPQPPPTPVDMADRAFAAALRPWVAQHHTGTNGQVATAARRWLATKNLTTHTSTHRYATNGELAGILAEVDIDPVVVTQVLARLTDLGVPVDRLVTITEETP